MEPLVRIAASPRNHHLTGASQGRLLCTHREGGQRQEEDNQTQIVALQGERAPSPVLGASLPIRAIPSVRRLWFSPEKRRKLRPLSLATKTYDGYDSVG